METFLCDLCVSAARNLQDQMPGERIVKHASMIRKSAQRCSLNKAVYLASLETSLASSARSKTAISSRRPSQLESLSLRPPRKS